MSTLKGNILLPRAACFLFLEQTPFQKGVGAQEKKQEVAKVVSLVKMTEMSHPKHEVQQNSMSDQQRLISSRAYAQSDQSLCWLLGPSFYC